MRLPSRDEYVGKIAGFLYGVSALNGEIREYEGSAFLVEIESTTPNIAREINKHYAGQHKFSFSSIEQLAGGLSELEKSVVEYMLPKFQVGDDKNTEEIGQYLAFRLLDMINFMFDKVPLSADVTQLQDKSLDHEITFFGIVTGRLLLVLQFNRHFM